MDRASDNHGYGLELDGKATDSNVSIYAGTFLLNFDVHQIGLI